MTPRFEKTGNRVLNQARDLVGDALLTAFGDEPRWGMARALDLFYTGKTINTHNSLEGL